MSKRTSHRLVVVAAALAVAHAVVYIPFVQPHANADTPSYTSAAHALLEGRYSVPLGEYDITGARIDPRARQALQHDTYRTPVFPAFLAAAGGGSSEWSVRLVIALQCLLMGMCVLLLAAIVRLLAGERTATVAAAAYALDPYSKRYASLVLS
jgi:hypothetical protein